ncbi:hypothetical protein F5B21DRAFT_507429 [Xylaria acuta]|nr:hypothetical protein F5B21DRAFT_507429 [Xylaria acuta]
MSVRSCASKARSSDEYIEITNSEHAAVGTNAVLGPIMKTNPAGLHIISVWGILCHAVPELGNYQRVSRLLIALVSPMQMLQNEDEAGNNAEYEWGGSL